MRLIIKDSLQSSAACIVYFFTLWEGVDNAQSFPDYNLSSKLSFRILLSITCTSVTGGNMINRRQL